MELSVLKSRSSKTVVPDLTLTENKDSDTVLQQVGQEMSRVGALCRIRLLSDMVDRYVKEWL